MKFSEIKEFNKDVKKLTKKYRSIPEDIETVKKVLAVMPDARPPFSFQIDKLGITTCVIKVKKIACKALKGKGARSGLRLVYAHFNNSNNEDTKQQEDEIVMVELYHKAEQEQYNRERITSNFE